MIERKEGKRRLLIVELRAHEMEPMRVAGFQVIGDLRGWRLREGYAGTVNLCSEERDALRFARGVFGDKPPTMPQEKSGTLARLSSVQTRVQDAATIAERVGALLQTKEWRGSELVDYRDDTVKPCVVLVHPSGARARLYADTQNK